MAKGKNQVSEKNLEIELTYLNWSPFTIAQVAQKGKKADPMYVGDMPIVFKPRPSEKGKMLVTMPKNDYLAFRSGAKSVESCVGIFRRTGDVAREFRLSDYQGGCWTEIGGLQQYKGMPVRVLTYELERFWDEKELAERAKEDVQDD